MNKEIIDRFVKFRNVLLIILCFVLFILLVSSFPYPEKVDKDRLEFRILQEPVKFPQNQNFK